MKHYIKTKKIMIIWKRSMKELEPGLILLNDKLNEAYL